MSNRQSTAAALGLVVEALIQAQRISTLLLTAHNENRELNQAEWEAITTADDEARANLVRAIEAARAGQPQG